MPNAWTAVGTGSVSWSCRVSSEWQQSESTELGSAAAGDPLTADGYYEQFKAAYQGAPLAHPPACHWQHGSYKMPNATDRKRAIRSF